MICFVGNRDEVGRLVRRYSSNPGESGSWDLGSGDREMAGN